MTSLRCIISLLFATAAVLGQFDDESKPTSTPKEPGEMVQRLYNEVSLWIRAASRKTLT
jgi:hypothetical protein